jgi:hypothetical protein
MRIDLGTQLNFFHLVGMLVFLGLFFALGLLVAKFAKVHQPADRRGSIGRHFDQVDPMRTRHRQRFAQGEHAELPAIDADYPDLAGTDLTVNPDK